MNAPGLRQGYGGQDGGASVRAVVIFVALAVLHTWPLASAPHRLSLNYNADTQLNTWIVSWIAHTLPTHPSAFWQGNTSGAVVLLAIVTMVETRSVAGLTRLATSTAAGAVLALPVLWPHLTRGIKRPLVQVADFSATLAADPNPVLLVEFPFYPPDGMFQNGEYVLNATAHWRPIANGYSGFTPMSYRERSKTLWFFPEQEAVDTLLSLGATHAMVHLELFLDQAPSVIRALDTQPRLRLLAADGKGHRLYRVVRE